MNLLDWSTFDAGTYVPQLLQIAGRVAVYIFSLAFPVVAYALLSKRVTARQRRLVAAGSIVTCVAIVYWVPLDVQRELLELAASFGYYALLAAVWFALHRRRDVVRLNQPAMILLSAWAFVLLPALFAPLTTRWLIMLFGWEAMLSAHSFYCEAPARKQQQTLADCLVFIVVNPCLVLANSGKITRAPGVVWRGTSRFALGIATVALQAIIFAYIQTQTSLSGAAYAAWPSLDILPALLSFSLLQLFLGFLNHSGRASLQTSMMRWMGHELPERYHYPLFSPTPGDFWRRWNTYVGVWFQRYVFVPCSLTLSRTPRRWQRALAVPAAVTLTFFLGGVWHELALYLKAGIFEPGIVITFVLHGLAIIIWVAAERLLWAAINRLGWTPGPIAKRTALVVSWAGTLCVLCLITWLMVPSLDGSGLHPVLDKLLRSVFL